MATKEEIIEQFRGSQVSESVERRSRSTEIQRGLKGDAIELALQMKKGCGNSVQLSLDGDKNSKAYLSFRVLSVPEELDIEREMSSSGFQPKQDAYNILWLLKRLAKATTPPPSNIPHQMQENQPIFNEHELGLLLSKGQLIGLGFLYNDFLNRHNPNLANFTKEEIDQLINELGEAVADPKLRAIALPIIYSECNSSLIYAALIECVTRLSALMQHVDK